MIYIDLDTSKEELSEFLNKIGWTHDETVTDLSRPGEGNMNVVIRVTTDHRSFILKQSRAYVNKFKNLPAPLSRIDTEFQFYNAVNNFENNFPDILNYSKENNLLMMEDLGDTRDFTSIYAKGSINKEEIVELTNILNSIHASQVPTNYPSNLTLRKLNHQHIFVLPFLENNGFDLNAVQPGLETIAELVKTNDSLKQIVNTIGDSYLSSGTHLLHGDYYPGSWMLSGEKIYVLDPEFSFQGFPEFDLGVMAGHLLLASRELRNLSIIKEVYGLPFDNQVMERMAGIEMIRRIIGLAQLPMERSLSEKKSLLELATELIMR